MQEVGNRLAQTEQQLQTFGTTLASQKHEVTKIRGELKSSVDGINQQLEVKFDNDHQT